MSDPIQPYAGLSPYRSQIAIGSDGLLYWPKGVIPRKTCVIYGAAGWRQMRADGIFDSDECVVLSLNNFWGHASRDSENRIRACAWFEIHEPRPPIQDRHDMEWLRTCPVPIFTTEPFPQNPRAVPWPLEYFVAKYRRRYVSCTFVCQILSAFEAGFEELRVYGLDLLRGTQRERTVESSAVSYWLGYVEGRGMRVVIDPNTHLLLLQHPFVYGFEYADERDFVKTYCSQWDALPQAI